MEFQPGTINIATEGNTQTSVNGMIAVGTGLGYRTIDPDPDAWRDIGEGWQMLDMSKAYIICHLASGHRLPAEFILEEHAQKVIEQAALLTDWTQSYEQLANNPEFSALARQYGEIAGRVPVEELANELRQSFPDLTDNEIAEMIARW